MRRSLQDEREIHVHSQELLTAELTSRSGWARIICRVQTVAVTRRKTAGPGHCFMPILPHSSHPSKSWVNCMTWALPLPPTTILDSYLKLMPSMRALTVSDDCRVTVKAYVRDICLWEILLSVCPLPDRVGSEKSNHAGACRFSNECETARKVQQDMQEVMRRKTTNCAAVKRNITH